MEGNKKSGAGLNDEARFPLIKDRRFLNQLKQDEFAPTFNFQSGDRLDKVHLEKVNQYAQKIIGPKKFWEKGVPPNWLESYLSWCIRTVPFYSERSPVFSEQPTIRRKDVSSGPWDFVSAESDLDDLLVHQTSGSTGAPMPVLFEPVTQACWIPQLQSILDNYHIKLVGKPNAVAIALVCSQSETMTYASLSTYLSEAGILKINLNPDTWKDSSHPLKYLEKYNPEILTGDPFAFAHLLELQPTIRPKALVSSSMKITDGVRKKLEAYFSCPVIDVYSLTECRMVAYAENGRHRAIRPELYLEVFDQNCDVLLPYGERGELVITGGINPFLPFIRYRTGDFCKLEIENGIPYLVDLEARTPVPFYTKQGKLINNVEISREMTQYSLVRFTLHQDSHYHLTFTGWSDEDLTSKILEVLSKIFGDDILIDISIQPVQDIKKYKTDSYSSDFQLNI